MLLAIRINTRGSMGVSVTIKPCTVLPSSFIHCSDYISWTERMIVLVNKILVSKSDLFLK
jgi:hypothetical protein